MCGDDAMMLIASRGMPLDSSLSAPAAQSSTLSADPGLHQCGDEAVGQREHRDEHRDDEPDAERVSSVDTAAARRSGCCR
jgi:hypothetical protein